MEFWYFKFEGRFKCTSSEYGKGLFSGCLIPESNYMSAKLSFLNFLKENQIKIVDIVNEFSVDGTLLDPKDVNNTFWINFYKESKTVNKPVFDVWHLYEIGT